MFLSLGAIRETRRGGFLFIDFEDPCRLRLNGVAAIDDQDPLLAEHYEAQVIVRVAVRHLFVNCPRYVHTYRKITSSPFVPQAGQTTPIPDWKRKAALRDALPERDKRRLAEEDDTPDR